MLLLLTNTAPETPVESDATTWTEAPEIGTTWTKT